MNEWNDHSRFTYNKTINYINDNQKSTFFPTNAHNWDDYFYDSKKQNPKEFYKKNTNEFYSKLELRNFIVPKSACSTIPWVLNTPKSVREFAVFEAHKNLSSALTNLKNNNIQHFDIGFKSKKSIKWTIGLPKESIKCYGRTLGIYEERTTNFRIKTTEQINKVEHDSTIHFDGLHYYIIVPYEVERKTNNTNNWFVSMDPGIRKFQTLYCPDEDSYVMIGNRSSEKLYEKLEKLDFLCSKVSNKRNKISKLKIRERIQNLQKEVHCKVSNYICNNYLNIYAPKLTKDNDIINKKRRKINSKTVRKMVVFGHCKFIERLKTKANEFTNVNLNIITEEYTSQTCLVCKELTKTSLEIFKCKNCNFTIDRDVLGSTNILLKNW